MKVHLPTPDTRTRVIRNRTECFDPVRKKYVVMTAEETVRQSWIQYLVEDMQYPMVFFMVEKKVEVNGRVRRLDLGVCNKDGKPVILFECKEPDVPVSQEVAEQLARYNFPLQARYLVMSNGIHHFAFECDWENKTTKQIKELPTWRKLQEF